MNDMPEPEEMGRPVGFIVCIGCAREIPEDADFCPHCGAAIGPYCWWDPLKRIYAQGHVYRRLTSGRAARWATVVALVMLAGYGAILLVTALAAGAGLSRGVLLSTAVILLLVAAFARRLIRHLRRPR